MLCSAQAATDNQNISQYCPQQPPIAPASLLDCAAMDEILAHSPPLQEKAVSNNKRGSPYSRPKSPKSRTNSQSPELRRSEGQVIGVPHANGTLRAPSLLQTILEQSRATFKQPKIAHDQLHRLTTLCNSLAVEHVWIPSVAKALADGSREPVKYIKIMEIKDMVSVGIFFLRRHAVLPLHNHPGMTVLSKCIMGNVCIQSYDWADESRQAAPGVSARARYVGETTVDNKSETELVFPDERNLHSILALEDCMFLDIIGPPYSDDRPCVYYRITDNPKDELLAVGEECTLEVMTSLDAEE